MASAVHNTAEVAPLATAIYGGHRKLRPITADELVMKAVSKTTAAITRGECAFETPNGASGKARGAVHKAFDDMVSVLLTPMIADASRQLMLHGLVVVDFHDGDAYTLPSVRAVSGIDMFADPVPVVEVYDRSLRTVSTAPIVSGDAATTAAAAKSNTGVAAAAATATDAVAKQGSGGMSNGRKATPASVTATAAAPGCVVSIPALLLRARAAPDMRTPTTKPTYRKTHTEHTMADDARAIAKKYGCDTRTSATMFVATCDVTDTIYKATGQHSPMSLMIESFNIMKLARRREATEQARSIAPFVVTAYRNRAAEHAMDPKNSQQVLTATMKRMAQRPTFSRPDPANGAQHMLVDRGNGSSINAANAAVEEARALGVAVRMAQRKKQSADATSDIVRVKMQYDSEALLGGDYSPLYHDHHLSLGRETHIDVVPSVGPPAMSLSEAEGNFGHKLTTVLSNHRTLYGGKVYGDKNTFWTGQVEQVLGKMATMLTARLVSRMLLYIKSYTDVLGPNAAHRVARACLVDLAAAPLDVKADDDNTAAATDMEWSTTAPVRADDPKGKRPRKSTPEAPTSGPQDAKEQPGLAPIKKKRIARDVQPRGTRRGMVYDAATARGTKSGGAGRKQAQLRKAYRDFYTTVAAPELARAAIGRITPFAVTGDAVMSWYALTCIASGTVDERSVAERILADVTTRRGKARFGRLGQCARRAMTPDELAIFEQTLGAVRIPAFINEIGIHECLSVSYHFMRDPRGAVCTIADDDEPEEGDGEGGGGGSGDAGIDATRATRAETSDDI